MEDVDNVQCSLDNTHNRRSRNDICGLSVQMLYFFILKNLKTEENLYLEENASIALSAASFLLKTHPSELGLSTVSYSNMAEAAI